jgi:hypothetical protein
MSIRRVLYPEKYKCKKIIEIKSDGKFKFEGKWYHLSEKLKPDKISELIKNLKKTETKVAFRKIGEKEAVFHFR